MSGLFPFKIFFNEGSPKYFGGFLREEVLRDWEGVGGVKEKREKQKRHEKKQKPLQLCQMPISQVIW